MGSAANWLKFLFICVASVCVASVCVAHAKPTISEFKTETGFRVLMVDIGKGNLAQVSVFVPTGMYHDEPIHRAGLSHLLKHQPFRGSRRYRNPGDFTRVRAIIGGTANAYTTSDHTLYYLNGHPSALDTMMSFLGSLTTEPLFQPEDFAKEKLVVMNEAVQYQRQDKEVFNHAIYMGLLPKDHPLHKYMVGSQAQLSAMDLDDVKDLYYANYRPDNMTIMVVGNFSRPINGKIPLDRQSVLNDVTKNFVVPVDPRAAPKRPELYKPSQNYPNTPLYNWDDANLPRYVEVGTKNEFRRLHFAFQLSTEGMTLAEQIQLRVQMEALANYLSLNAEGGLVNELKSPGANNSKPLATSVSFYESNTTGFSLFKFTVELTQAGASQRQDVGAKVLHWLHQLQKEPISNEILALLKSRYSSSYADTMGNPTQTTRLLTDIMKMGSDPRAALELDSMYQRLTVGDIQTAAQRLTARTLLAAYIGPEVNGTESLPIFDRPMVRHTLPALWQTAITEGLPGAPKYAPILNGRILPKPRIMTQESFESPQFIAQEPELRVVAHPDSSAAKAAYLIEQKFTLSASSEEMLLITLFINAFKERYKEDFLYLRNKGTALSLSNRNYTLSLNISGTPNEAWGVALWIMSELKRFSPTRLELETMLERRRNFLQNEVMGEFAAGLAQDELFSILYRSYASIYTQWMAATNFNLDAALTQFGDTHILSSQRHDLSVIGAGAVSRGSVLDLAGQIRTLYPHMLTKDERQDRTRTLRAIESLAGTHLRTLPDWKGMEEFSLARAIQGPPSLTVDHLAFDVLGSLLGERVFALNRSQKGLGYSHGGASIVSSPDIYMLLYGETDGRHQWSQIVLGWEQVLSELSDPTKLTDDHIQQAIWGRQRKENIVQTEPLGIAYRLSDSLHYYNDPYGRTLIADGFNALTVADVRSVIPKLQQAVSTTVALSRLTPLDSQTPVVGKNPIGILPIVTDPQARVTAQAANRSQGAQCSPLFN